MTTRRSTELLPIGFLPRLGDAPNGWRWIKLTEIARLESGHTPSRARLDWWGGDISWLSLTEIRALDGGWVKETQIKTNADGIANSAARILPRGTVCFSRTASVGFVAILDRPMATSQDFANWVCGDKLAPEFLMYALVHSREMLRSIATGATHKTIYMPALGAFHLCMPEHDEQTRICVRLKAQLAAVNEARQAALAQLSDAKRLIPAILESAFADTDDAEWFAISDVARTASGTTPSRSRKEYWQPPKHPWVKTGEVAFNPIERTEEAISERALAECSLNLLPPGTVLVAMYGQGKTRGQSAVLKVTATTNQACFAILPNERIDAEYLQFWLRRSYAPLRALSEARGGNQSNLNGEILNAFEIPLLPMDKQKAIAGQIKFALAEAEALQRSIEQRLSEIELLPSRLLAQAFDGKH